MSRSLLALGALLAGLAVVSLSPWLAAPTTLHGEVRGPEGPLADARVRRQASALSTTSDQCGRFQLPGSRAGDAPGGPETASKLAGPPGVGGKITAAREGYFIGSARADRSPLSIALAPLPAQDNPTYPWVDPDPIPGQPHNCGNCHREIYQEWKQSGHSRSIAGRHFRDLYDGKDRHGRPGVGWGLLTQYDAGAGVCFSCHAPALPDRAPATLDWDNPPPTALHGVHCDYCHKIAEAGRDKLGLNHGRFNLQLLRPAVDADGEVPRQTFFGPLDDVDRGEDAWSPLYRSSLYCASCHEGVVFGVHVYSTWSEWLASPARRQGRQCQDCHNRPTGRMSNIAPGHGGLNRDPGTLGNHRFFAGSPEEMLRSCLHVAVFWDADHPGRQCTLKMEVKDVGHRVPTGFPDRQLLLVVEGLDVRGRPVSLEAGPTLPAFAGPELAGKPGRLYAKLLRDFQGKTPVPFWRAEPDASDDRLTPGAPETVRFVFAERLSRFRVRVLYRRFWQEQIALKGWPDRDVTVLEMEQRSP